MDMGEDAAVLGAYVGSVVDEAEYGLDEEEDKEGKTKPGVSVIP